MRVGGYVSVWCKRAERGARGRRGGAPSWGPGIFQTGESARRFGQHVSGGGRTARGAAVIPGGVHLWSVCTRGAGFSRGCPGHGCAQVRQILRDLSSHRWGHKGYPSPGKGWLSTENREKSWLPRVRSTRGSVLRTNPRHGRPAIREGKSTISSATILTYTGRCWCCRPFMHGFLMQGISTHQGGSFVSG